MSGDCALNEALIAEIIRRNYPGTQAIYLFGSHAMGQAWPSSDVDLALLLPQAEAKRERFLAMSDCAAELSLAIHAEVDFVNLREVETILQKEIVHGGRRIATYDEAAADRFEMQVLKAYQKLDEERAEIVAQGLKSGRFYQL